MLSFRAYLVTILKVLGTICHIFFHSMACQRLNQLDLLVLYDEAATIKHSKIDFWNKIEIVVKIIWIK